MLKPGQVIKKIKAKDGSDIILRLVDKNDAKDFMEMYNSIIDEQVFVGQTERETLQEEINWVKEELEKLKLGIKIQLFAESGDNIVGQCSVERDSGRLMHTANLNISIVKPFREIEIGTVISKEAIKLAKKYLKIKLIKLVVTEDNKRAFNLYKKLGFKKFGYLPRGIKSKKGYTGRIYMYKEL